MEQRGRGKIGRSAERRKTEDTLFNKDKAKINITKWEGTKDGKEMRKQKANGKKISK